MPPPSTHLESKFTPFSLRLPNNATLTGISHIPSPSSTSPKFRPLLIALHGGTCTSTNYDINTQYTASTPSSAFSIPFIAIDRPCYGGTTSFLPLSDPSQTFFHETAKWLHEHILPTLWTHFGIPNTCTAIVTTSHSMAVGPAIIAAAAYSQDPSPAYPLAGIILSGFGTRWIEHDFSSIPNSSQIKYPFAIKKSLMLSEDDHHCADPALFPLLEAQDVPMPLEELLDLRQHWPTYFHRHADEVTVPIMYGLGEWDWLWEGTEEQVREFAALFPKTKAFQGGVVRGGCHALEWGYVSHGWYASCFGWAMEVVAALGMEKIKDGVKGGAE